MELMIISSEIQPPQIGKRWITRERVACFLQHPDEDKFLLIKESYGITIPWWGMQEQESLEEAIYREIKEETWYFNIIHLKKLNFYIQLDRYSEEKNSNLHSINYFFQAQLKNLEQIKWNFEIKREKKENIEKELSLEAIKIARKKQLS